MTDKELLELAAKAAGYKHLFGEVHHKSRSSMAYSEIGFREVDEKGYFTERMWNPLTNDGDALRLAVKLRMRTHHDGSCANAELSTGQKHCWTEAAVVESNDHYAATRRAIVRAAAEIGKGMK